MLRNIFSTKDIVTLWGKRAENFIGIENEVYGIQGGFVAEFGETKSINIFAKSVLWKNPDLPEAKDLKSWYRDEMENMI